MSRSHCSDPLEAPARADDLAPVQRKSAGVSPRKRLRGQVAGLSYEEQLEAVRPPDLPPVQRLVVGDEGDDEAGDGLQTPWLAAVPIFNAVLEGNTFLRHGCRDELAVGTLQGALNELGFDCGTADGSWGPKTNNGFMRYQLDRGLLCDGVLGPNSLVTLDHDVLGFSPPKNIGGGTGGGGGQSQPAKNPAVEGRLRALEALYERLFEIDPQTPVADVAELVEAILGLPINRLVPPDMMPDNGLELLALVIQLYDSVLRVALGNEGVPYPATIGETNDLLAYCQTGLWRGKRSKELKAKYSMLWPYEEHRDQCLRIEQYLFWRLWLAGHESLIAALKEQPDQPASSTSAPKAKRAAVVAYALQHVGQVAENQGSGQKRHVRMANGKMSPKKYECCIGGHILDDMFKTSTTAGVDLQASRWWDNGQEMRDGAFLPPSVKGSQIPEWCGIFVNYIYLHAGVKTKPWNFGGKSTGWGSGQWKMFLAAGNRDPEPGDLATFRDKNSHHAIVIRVEGDTLTTIDGNVNSQRDNPDSTVGGRILTYQRPKSMAFAFYEMPK